VLSVLRSTAELVDEPLNVLESGQDPLLPRGMVRRRLGLDLDAELREQGIVLFGDSATSRLRLHPGQERDALCHPLFPGSRTGNGTNVR
jgi:hypothetical protein